MFERTLIAELGDQSSSPDFIVTGVSNLVQVIHAFCVMWGRHFHGVEQLKKDSVVNTFWKCCIFFNILVNISSIQSS